MSAKLSKQPDLAKRKKQPRAPGRLYVGILVALTVFFFGVIFWPRPTPSYRAEVVLQQMGAANSNAAADSRLFNVEQIRQTVLSDGYLQLAANRLADANLSFGGLAGSEAMDAQLNQQLRDQIDVEVNQEGSFRTTVLIGYQEERAERAKRLVAVLAELLMAEYSSFGGESKAGSVSHEIEEDLFEAREKEQQALDALASFLETRFLETQHLTIGPNGASEKQPGIKENRQTMNSSSEGQAVSAQQREKEAQRNAIKKQIAELIELRRSLLVKFTSEHPQVIELAFQIEDLGKQLPEAAKALEFSNEAEYESPAGESVNQEEANEDQLRAARQLAELRQERLEASQRRAMLEKEREDNLAAAKTAMRHSAMGLIIIEPAQIVGRVGGALQPLSIIKLLALSMFLGLAAALLAVSAKRQKTFLSRGQIESRLSLPVVGEISTAHGPTISQNLVRRAGLMRFAARGCEFALGVLLIGFILFAFFESPAIDQFVEDPFTALSAAAVRFHLKSY